MTEVTAPRSDTFIQERLPTIHYQVAMPQPETHLFEVTLHLVNYTSPILDLKLPVWTPGSYLVREYAKNLQDFAAFANDQPLPWWKKSKNHWQIDKSNVSELTIRYRIFANELSVRTNHLDITHGYFNGAALFFRLPGWDQQPIRVTIVPPYPEWQVTSPLPADAEASNTFYAADFDTLVDSPFEIGSHQVYQFIALGKPHELAIWGQGNLEPERAIADIQKIIQVEADIFGGLPYQRYVFLLHLFHQAYGGLEHKNSCSLIYQRFGFRAQDKYERFMQLVAHEFFHLWNVKRIRPKALEVFDYDQENYTPSLWFCEGTTSHYDLLIPLWAGIYDSKSYLNHLSKEITRFLTTPGRKIQPLSESSFDAWIKLYRPDANSGNSQISYYLKGAMVTLLLDLLIRAKHRNQRSLDDIMRQMWQQFGQAEIGFTPEQLQSVIESVADIDLGDFFKRYLDGTEELPFNEYLEPFGLKLAAEPEEEPYLGIKVNSENGKEIIKFVEAGSPAQKAGIDPGDELLAINGIKVTANNLSDRLKDFQAQDTIQVAVFHQDLLRSVNVTLAEPRPIRYQVISIHNPDSVQQENLAGWLGVRV
ncbi:MULTISPECIES: M61 family metallopeptidase [unclassified Tolypothrix]|uniref:M61 family metallopeptidase n=1 Tax=unclassified Tolypothrix TaxID=2649714 RepID=UPI0005EAB0FB|nr:MULTISPECIES: M61 family metallopeptidase [unclassified Tolypothrix]BAY94222.1 peptidase M61 domain-containing protein [Microchaete diplosiphon NIES-3275]EKF03851.1 PDZ domain protein [Tolypothrix sp. PCC 7601]MBE9087567.1 M61 family metallopeptidase [Tolypothrix sp. LEGE 11397]UYD27970.1 M61 family metallopeptidase [Tolypothrix sp. PCC 7712]UYD36160.1 M61 family metallopeptidase [Tolypothrix sp. PCC 7601]